MQCWDSRPHRVKGAMYTEQGGLIFMSGHSSPQWDDNSESPKILHCRDMDQYFPTFLVLRSFNKVPHIVGAPPPNHKIILLLLHNYNLGSVMNHKYLIFDPPPKGLQPTG